MVTIEPKDGSSLSNASIQKFDFIEDEPDHEVVCIAAERPSYMKEGHIGPSHRPGYDIGSVCELCDFLSSERWTRYISTSSVWKAIYVMEGEGFQALIAIRRNGVDYKYVDGAPIVLGIEGSDCSIPSNMMCRNFYNESRIDLIERTVSFSRCARSSRSLERYYMGTGRSRISYAPPEVPDDFSAYGVNAYENSYKGRVFHHFQVRRSDIERFPLIYGNKRWAFIDVTDIGTKNVIRLSRGSGGSGHHSANFVGIVWPGNRPMRGVTDNDDNDYVPSGYLGDGVWSINGTVADLGR